MRAARHLSAFLRPAPLPPLARAAPPRLCPTRAGAGAGARAARALSGGGGGGAKGAAAKRPRAAKPAKPPKAARGALSNVGAARPTIQWYPGHIAKAERALRESLRAVDVVIEVRDARIPAATAHPSVPGWVGGRTRVLALGRADLTPERARADWRAALRKRGEEPRFVDARRGRGVAAVRAAAVAAGDALNARRRARGLLARPVRALVIGFPNVGKSALINRLVGRRAAKSMNRPGVTRSFQWVRIDDSISLLDMPGVIPAKLVDQDTALRLAICDDIGHAAYDRQITAGLLVEELKRVARDAEGYFDIARLRERYKVDATRVTGEEFLHLVAERLHQGDLERTAMRILTEFRAGDLGPVALEKPDMGE